MKIVKLAEVVKELESGARPKGGVSSETGTIPSLGAEHLSDDGNFNFHKNKFVTIDFFNNLKSGKIKRNDILIVKDGATTGKVSFVQKDFPFDRASINEHVFRIEIDPRNGFSKYVYLFLKSSEGKKQILNDFRGATVGGISRQFIELTKIPLPPLDDQIRIATILTRAEKLIAKRKESIKALDEFLKSTFLEMFGDPVRNEKGWERLLFGDILSG
jgi:type I restriction enzyme, S subunit